MLGPASESEMKRCEVISNLYFNLNQVLITSWVQSVITPPDQLAIFCLSIHNWTARRSVLNYDRTRSIPHFKKNRIRPSAYVIRIFLCPKRPPIRHHPHRPSVSGNWKQRSKSLIIRTYLIYRTSDPPFNTFDFLVILSYSG